MMRKGLISFLSILFISSPWYQGELIYAQEYAQESGETEEEFPIGGLNDKILGRTTTYYVDDALHPDAALMAAIVAGRFDSNYVREPSLVEKKFLQSQKKYESLWGNLPQIEISNGNILKIGSTGPRVAALKRRLGVQGDDKFGSDLADKISLYRAAHSLPDGRHADDILLDSLNLGFEYYNQKIALNIVRAMELPSDMGDKFIWVNAANQILYMIEDDQISDEMRVIVGTADNQTPLMAAFIRFAVVNPYWNIPYDLVRDRYAPLAQKQGPNYLTDRSFEMLSGWDDDAAILSYSQIDWDSVVSGQQKLRMRQRPGPGNGMGDIKFMFPNRLGVYLHDSHNEASFLSDKRAISAGCVRIEKPWVLAQWLYGKKPKADYSQAEQIVNLEQKIPVYLTYFTAMPTDKGFSFYEDIYSRDTPPQSVQPAAF